ncbi:TadG family pilus assembly protein [Comamonas sp. NoAH]|uniref:TadG family pilus assembly protein n=1 Tax=Comamonas halotolerans TaxID=3041496 RepID=UPI0024E0C853|nr:TadG family pilus assembly protein [Comamonas sp. NoAH]
MCQPSPRSKHQKGSVLVQFALLLGVIVTILGVIDLGYLFYAKRELQRNADLSALHAVQYLDFSATGDLRAAPCEKAGLESINANWPDTDPITAMGKTVTCGEWNPGRYTGPQHFSASSSEVNAARVVLQGKSPTFFPGTWSREITAQAIAKRGEPLAVFSVGSKLVSVGCRQELAPLIQILKIVGVGDPCVTVNGYDGLATATVSASGLLRALGLPLEADLTVLDINNLLVAEKVSLGAILDAAATLGGHSELLDVNAELLRMLGLKLGIDALNLEVPLGSGVNGPGIFAGIHAPDAATASALDVQVGVLDIITAAVGVGTTGRGLSIPGLSVKIPGVLPNLLQVKAGLIEPPSIAIGGVGAKAYNAQIRLYIDVDTGGGVLGGLLQLLGTKIKLPIFVDVTRAKATLTELSCKVPLKDSTAKIQVDASVAQACIGKVDGDPFSTRTPICESIQKETLISALGLIKIHNKIEIDALEDSYLSPELLAGETWSSPGNSLNLGTTLSNLVNELLRLLGELLGAPTDGNWSASENEASAQKLANYYLGIGSQIHPNGAIPKDQSLGLLGPAGAYDVGRLRDRLKADIDRTSQSCLLLQILCWQNNEWAAWASDIQSANIASGRACWGSTPEGFVTVGAAGNATDVSRFNQCVARELKEALLETPNSKPNYLQVLLSPLTELLHRLLDPIGNLLAGPLLRDLLGIELGINDVHVTSVGCGGGQLVY